MTVLAENIGYLLGVGIGLVAWYKLGKYGYRKYKEKV